VIRDVITIA